jgi:hypothetical protein
MTRGISSDDFGGCTCVCHPAAVDLVGLLLERSETVEIVVTCAGCDCSGVVGVGGPDGQGPTEWDAQPGPTSKYPRGASFYRPMVMRDRTA